MMTMNTELKSNNGSECQTEEVTLNAETNM